MTGEICKKIWAILTILIIVLSVIVITSAAKDLELEKYTCSVSDGDPDDYGLSKPCALDLVEGELDNHR